MRTFAIAAVAEFLSFFMIVINARAYNQGLYFWTMATDSLFITQGFFVSKWMVESKEARGTAAYFGFLVGGTLGSVSAIWITKHVYGG